MSRMVIAFLFAMLVCSTYAYPRSASNEEECGPNEVFDECGTACEPSCTEPEPDVCIYRCFPKCRCVGSYLRNSAGECVLSRHCN